RAFGLLAGDLPARTGVAVVGRLPGAVGRAVARVGPPVGARVPAVPSHAVVVGGVLAVVVTTAVVAVVGERDRRGQDRPDADDERDHETAPGTAGHLAPPGTGASTGTVQLFPVGLKWSLSAD